MRLTALGPAIPGRNEYWRYQCACGNVIVKTRRSVACGSIKSCGCLNTEMRLARNLKHGLAPRGNRNRAYWVWVAMKQRCSNPNNPDYPSYGGRGISVCAAWQESYETFHSDMGARPSKRHSVDRIDNNGNYEPGNCRWATSSEQAFNRRPKGSNS